MTAKKENPNRTGRPTKFPQEKSEKEFLGMVEKMGGYGFIDTEIADIIGIATSTLNRWKQNFPEFWESIKKGKIKADMEGVKSLYKRVKGFEYEELRTEIIVDQKTGKPVTIADPVSGKKITTAKITKTTKHVIPDVAACHIWNKNRRPQNWKDRHHIEGNLNISNVSMKDLKKSTEEYNGSTDESTE